MEIVVDSSGKVSNAKALSGTPELFKAALDNIKQWQFEPPAHALKTVHTWTFHLKNAGSGDARKDLRLRFTYEGYCVPNF